MKTAFDHIEQHHAGAASTHVAKPDLRLSVEIRDDAALTRLGKKPVLKRNFGFMSILSFSCTILVTWEGMSILFAIGLTNGGPAGIVYGYILAWIGTTSTFITLSELASMAPTSGGQYHWVAMLAPSSCQRFLSYTTGWLTVLGWQSAVATGGYLCGTIIRGMVVLCNPTTYVPQTWHAVLIIFAMIAFAIFINVVSGLLPKFESMVFVLHVAGFFAILIPLVYLGPRGSNASVFQTFNNGGGWPTQGISFWVGLLGNVGAFFGADGAIHMCEEIQNAQVVVPRSILTAVAINGVLGFAMAIALLYTLGDVGLVSPTGFPFIDIYQQAVQNRAGATVMTAILLLMQLTGFVGIMAAGSRLLWSFARDRMLPGWFFLQKIDARTSIPWRAVAVTAAVSCLLPLINLGSPVAFNAFVSVAIAGVFGSYLIVIILFLWRRIRGDIRLPNSFSSDPGLVNVPGAPLTWGPWRFDNLFGTLNNVFCVAYTTIVFFFSFWPIATPVTLETMNWACLMFGGVMILSTVYYFAYAHKVYKGPRITITDPEVEMRSSS